MLQNDEIITSPSNARFKQILSYIEARKRRELKLCLVEGHDEIKHACEANAEIIELVVCQELLSENEKSLVALYLSKVAIFRISAQLMKKLSYREHPDGLILITKLPDLSLQNLKNRIDPKKRKIYLVSEDLEKPGNIGAAIRSAEALGVSGFIGAEIRTDFANPNIIRASKACIFSMPIGLGSNEECYEFLKKEGVKILAASPEASQSIWHADLSSDLAIIVGAEDKGLSNFWKDKADLVLAIPMFGKVNSLNVAQAATIMIYEVLRQGFVKNG